MQVFWLRHGTRNFTTGDVPLNDQGIQQAAELVLVPKFTSLKKILCSPKSRAQMTVRPLAQKLGIDIKIYDELDQMKSGESEQKFRARVEGLCKKIEEGAHTENLLVCTHSDWLNTASQIIPTDSLDLKYKMFQCAESVEFEIRNGLWMIK